MTRAAARDGYATLVDDLLSKTAEELDLELILRESEYDFGELAATAADSDTVQEAVVEAELEAYHDAAMAQFDVLATAIAEGEALVAVRDELLSTDPLADGIRADAPAAAREALADALFDRQRRVAEGVAAIIDAEASAFWPALAGNCERDVAEAMVTAQLALVEPLRAHRGAVCLTTTVDPDDIASGLGPLLGGPLEIEYTDEGIRAMGAAADVVRSRALSTLEEHY